MNASCGVPTGVVMTNIVMARRIAELEKMRLEFKTDMARQLWDETRHSLVMRALLDESGCDFGGYNYSDQVWLKYIVHDGLAETLAIEHVLEEGNTFQTNVPFCESLNEAGVDDFVGTLDNVDVDAAKIGAQLKPKEPLQARPAARDGLLGNL